MLLPFMEQTNLYETWTLLDGNGGNPTGLVAQGKVPAQRPTNGVLPQSVSIATYFCPSRRTPPQFATTTVARATANQHSVGDYGAVAFGLAVNGTNVNVPVNGGPAAPTTGPLTWDGAITVSRCYNPWAQTSPPFTMVGVEVGQGDFRSLTNFASVIDGLSNTAFVGEKAARKDALGRGEGATGTCPACNAQDG